jgi:glyoxylase-like metal-dependent hydrolase (beta-lactamase superfamily II)
MILEMFSSGPIETNTYILGCSKTGKACVIDAPQGCLKHIEKVLEKHNLSLSKILFTHSHWDHTAEAFLLKEHFKVPLLIHALDAKNLIEPGSDELPLFFPIQGVKPDLLFEEGDVILVGELELEVIATPGHTPGGVCFYLAKEGVLFSGDTLFKNSMGRVDFPQSNPNNMLKSLKRLAALPPQTKVFPGHGPSTTIGAESWMETADKKWG